MMSDFRHFIVATAGHVDHGKSALVKALTGTDPDRLPEEKVRGITIDLGFAHLELRSPAPPVSSIHLGIVDVPGHEDFVKNMVAGVGSIDVALLVVAADDGWMPQTEEHLQILSYLGVQQAVVALTKTDLAQDETSVVATIRDKLIDTPFAEAPIVPTSVLTGRGLDELKAALWVVAAKTPGPRDIGKPRLPVDRVFNLQGIGTIVTGTLTGGALRRGQSVMIQPSGKPTRIRNIQSYNRDVGVALPGTRTALNLPNLVPAHDINRGDVVTILPHAGVSDTVDVLLEISSRASRPVKNGARVRIHHGSRNVAAKVVFFSGENLDRGERALAQLRFEAPAFVFAGDRFVARDWAGQNTLAGGTVLDTETNGAPFRSERRLRFLSQRAEASEDVRPYLLSQLGRDGGARMSRLLLNSRFSEAEIGAAISALAAESRITVVGGCAVEAGTWSELRNRAVLAIDSSHRTHPEDFGLSLSDLHAILRPHLPVDDLFDALIKDLCGTEFVRIGSMIRRANFQPALPPGLQEIGAKLREALGRKPYDPPSRKELSPDAAWQQALRFLLETGEVVEINADVVMFSESQKQAAEIIRRFIREHGPATASDLRQAIGSSRRVIIPLLEWLDRAGVTERAGDRRALREMRPGPKAKLSTL